MEKEYLVKKWLNDDLSPEETKEFEALQESGFYRQILLDARQFKASEAQSMPSIDQFKENLPIKKSKGGSRFLYIYRIAAVLVVGLLVSYFYLNNRSTQFNTITGEQQTVSLPDASTVILNAQSALRFKESTWEKQREVELDGEAFFKVAKGSRFDVITEDGTVSVLGTEFTVKQRGTFFEVVCYEGHVQVASLGEKRDLYAGDSFRRLQGTISDGKINRETPSWTNNLSSFDNVPLSEVIAELERHYEVKVEFINVDLDRLFTGGFGHDDLENALRSITLPLQLNYNIKESGVVTLTTGEM